VSWPHSLGCLFVCGCLSCNAQLSALPAAPGSPEDPVLPCSLCLPEDTSFPCNLCLPDDVQPPGDISPPCNSDTSKPYVPPPANFTFEKEVFPHPLISRGKPAYSYTNLLDANRSRILQINDGLYRWDGESWTNNSRESWVAIQVGESAGEPSPITPAPLTRLLFEWNSGANYSYTDMGSGAPTRYTLEVSANSTDGKGGDWVELVNVSGNQVRTRTHLLEHGAGILWVRMRVFSERVLLDEIDIYDVSHSENSFDSWFFLGDSNTAHAMDRSKAHGSFAKLIENQTEGRFSPLVVNGGVGGDNTANALARLDSALEQHPHIRFWAIALGTNNVGGIHGQELANFRRDMLEIITRIYNAGRIPVLANIPFIGTPGAPCEPNIHRQGIHEYNRMIAELIEQSPALPGPNFYDYFEANRHELLNDGLHFTAEGYQSINRLWAEAVKPIYRAQP